MPKSVCQVPDNLPILNFSASSAKRFDTSALINQAAAASHTAFKPSEVITSCQLITAMRLIILMLPMLSTLGRIKFRPAIS
jgi:hypothetical protein